MARQTSKTLPRLEYGHYRVGIAIGIPAGVALGVLISDGRLLEIVAAGALALGLLAATLFFPTQQRARVVAVVAFVFALHVATVVVLDRELRVLGRDGFVTGDDRAYAQVSWAVAEMVRGQPTTIDWQTESYLIGPFVYLEAAVFLLLRSPNALIVEMLNAWFAALMMLFVFDSTRRMFGSQTATIAGLLAGTFPSVVIWTSLNLKDAAALLAIALALWAILRFQLAPGWRAFGFILLGTVGVWALRSYFVLLPLTGAALALLLTPGVLGPRRFRTGVTAIVLGMLSLVLVLNLGGSRRILADALRQLEVNREGLAAGARTAIVEPIIRLPARDGETFVIIPAPPTSSPVNVLHVAPGARIAAAAPEGSTGQIVPAELRVAPGDIVVVGAPDRTPAPSPERQPLSVSPTRPMLVVPAVENDEEAVRRTARYLPTGLEYALLAPFPWALSRNADLVTIPDMLLWYAVIVAAAFGLWFFRRRVNPLLTPAAFVVVGLIILALGEGNVGTLYRHRAMVIPASAVLAAAGMIAVWGWLRRLRGQVPRRPRSTSE